MRRVERLQVDRRQPGLPVVRVDDATAARRCRADELERGAHQQREAPRVVGIVDAADAVEAVAIEELRAVDEQRARAVAERRLEEADVARVAADASPETRSTSVPAVTPR